MVSVIHNGENGQKYTPIQTFTWIIDAVRFGYWLTDQTVSRKGQDRLFAFVSSPTLSCLPGFVLLGCVLRNKLSVHNQVAGRHNPTIHFLRLWEAGENAKLTFKNGKDFRILRLRCEECEKKVHGRHLSPDHFRKHPDQIHAVDQYTVMVTKGNTRSGPQWGVNTKNCLDYSLGKAQTSYERIFHDLSKDASLPTTSKTCDRINIFLAGPSRKTLRAVYGKEIQITSPWAESLTTLNELMNLDEDTGRNLNPHYWHDGAWLNPKARRQREGSSTVARRGVAIIDGAPAWERWNEALQTSTRVLVYHRTSSNLRYDRTTTILNQVHPYLGPAVVYQGHSWFKDFNPIRAFVHEWR